MTNEAICRQIQQGGDKKALMGLLYAQNEGLLTNFAKRYRDPKKNPDDFDDLMQDGFLALEAAAVRFDPGSDIKFTTYAGHWIRSYMGRCCVYKLAGLRSERKIVPVDSLERPMPVDEGLTLGDTIQAACDPIGQAEDQLERAQDREALEAALARIPENMQKIIRMYYFDGVGYTAQARSQGTTYSKIKSAADSGLARMNKDRALKAYADSRLDLYSRAIRGSNFFRTWTSPTEDAAFWDMGI